MKETWKPVVGYEGLYEVSNFGNIRSLSRNTTSGKILTPIKMWHGYLRVHLFKGGKSKQIYVHRIVAEAFIPMEEGKNVVNHIDENKQNNCVSNLEWCTHIENCNHGTAIQRTKEKLINHPRKSKPVEMFTQKGEFICFFPSTREAERQTNIRHKEINLCCKGERKFAGGYVWKYRKI